MSQAVDGTLVHRGVPTTTLATPLIRLPLHSPAEGAGPWHLLSMGEWGTGGLAASLMVATRI